MRRQFVWKYSELWRRYTSTLTVRLQNNEQYSIRLAQFADMPVDMNHDKAPVV